MPRLIAPLTDLQVRTAKPKAKPYKLADGAGLYLEVMPSGSKFWRLKYRQQNGAENRLTFGPYPALTLTAARAKRQTVKQLLNEGTDPGRARDEQVRRDKAAASNTFERVAREWHHNLLETWQPGTAKNILHRLQQDIFPVIGSSPIAEVQKEDLLRALRGIEQRGAREVAKRMRADCSRIFEFAIDSP